MNRRQNRMMTIMALEWGEEETYHDATLLLVFYGIHWKSASCLKKPLESFWIARLKNSWSCVWINASLWFCHENLKVLSLCVVYHDDGICYGKGIRLLLMTKCNLNRLVLLSTGAFMLCVTLLWILWWLSIRLPWNIRRCERKVRFCSSKPVMCHSDKSSEVEDVSASLEFMKCFINFHRNPQTQQAVKLIGKSSLNFPK